MLIAAGGLSNWGWTSVPPWLEPAASTPQRPSWEIREIRNTGNEKYKECTKNVSAWIQPEIHAEIELASTFIVVTDGTALALTTTKKMQKQDMPSCTCLQWGEKRKICKIIISSEISSNFMAGRQTPHPPIHLIALQCLLLLFITSASSSWGAEFLLLLRFSLVPRFKSLQHDQCNSG